MEIKVIRQRGGDTGSNLRALVKVINDPACKEVRLFASPTAATAAYSSSKDGPETNLPLVAACCRYSVADIAEVYILFDGLFLTAARHPRGLEVRELLDCAQVSGKAQFGTTRADFTATLDAETAVRVLLEVPAVALTPASRSRYFGLLSSVPEASYFQ